MHDVTEVSSPSLLTVNSSPLNSNLVQPLLSTLGWKDLKPAIIAAEQADQALALELQQAYDAYSKTSDDASQQRLQMALDQTIGELQADLKRVKKLEKEAAKRLTKPQTSSSGYLASWGSWLKQSAQTFFGSDDASLVERYVGIVQQRQESITALSRFREGLAAQVASQQKETLQALVATDNISPTARRLLEATPPETIGQYCYPSGRCNLNNLYDGISGFVLQGDVANDYSGVSVSSAGDINGDGFDDVLVGAYLATPPGRNNAGKTYVIFGSNQTNVWRPGVFNLTSLMDGQRGFVLQGETAGDQSGISVSSAGDINGDGLDDVLVGALYADPINRSNAGKTYIVFGSNKTNAWGSGALDLSSLMDGQRGFVLEGEALEDRSGCSVSSAGDINGDGLDDVLVGAYGADATGSIYDIGKTYVVFGSNQTGVWGTGALNLTSLINGQRGFVLQGEVAGDQSGFSVSSAGDINGDSIDDLLIGVYKADPAGRTDAGKSYVVFGSNQNNIWGSGALNLTSLMNGQRGFVLQGEVAGDWSGYSVSSAGDINGDGLADVMVGAYRADPTASRSDAGKSYIVFGSNQTNVWGSGVVDLSSLMDGQRGFVLQGEVASDYSGYSVSKAGDINGDGLDDVLIGAHAADTAGNNNVGKTYVVFGSNQTNTWGSGAVDLSSLMDGQRGFVLQGEVASDYSGYSISKAGDINGDERDDLLIGAFYADPAGRIEAGKSYVVFGDHSPQVWANQVAVYQGIPLILSNQNLNATYPSTVNFNMTSVKGGQFEYLSNPGQAITLFNQSAVWTGLVRFVPDGSSATPSYMMQIPTSKNILKMLPQNATVNFYGVLVNQLTIHQGEDLLMNSAFLDISANYPAIQVNITISNLQHGQFTLAPSNSFITQFTQADLLAAQIRFAHDGSNVAPSYNVTISDPVITLASSAAQVTFYRRPIWQVNQLTLTQGDNLFLGSRHINVTDDAPVNKVQFTISGLQHGQFRLAPSNNTITQFTQQQLLAGQVLFIHDKTGFAPSYQLALNDSYFTLLPEPAVISFTPLPPTLISNHLTILQGHSVSLSSLDLNATDPDPAFNVSDLVFTINNIQHGVFTLNASTAAITQFTQEKIVKGQVLFTHDGSASVPGYQVTVSNPQRSTTSTAANIIFDKYPTMINNRLTIETGESVVLALTNLQAVDDYTASGELLFAVNNINHGYFSELQNPTISITSFLQQRVRDSEIQFIHDGSQYAPSYIVKTIDGSGLESNETIAQINFKNTIPSRTAKGIDLQKLYTTFSSVGGIAVAIAGYMWWRRKTTAHRRGFELANNLRKAANLEYHDFMRFDGDVFKSKVENLLSKVDAIQMDFYKRLSPAEKKSFAVCIAEILEQRELLKPSGYGMGIYGWMLAFSVGWSQQLDFKKFEAQLTEIAQQAVTAWQDEASPTARWPYFSPTCKDKAKAFCCARPSRAGMFASDKVRLSRTEGVSLTDLKESKHQVIEMPSSSQKDKLVSTSVTSSSPRFFDSSTSSQELASFRQEVTNQFKQVAEGMQYMHHGMQEIAGNVKTMHEEVEQLKTETRPLLRGISSSSS